MDKERALAALSVALLASIALLHLSMPLWLRSFYLTVSGKSVCGAEELRRSEEHARRSIAAREYWDRNSRMIAREGDLEQWMEGGRNWWMPSAARLMLPWVIGEMAGDFYGSEGGSVSHGDVVLDCGADVGVFTRQALDRGAALVVAIEPLPDKEPCLRRNFAREILEKRVVVVSKGVWHEDSVLEIFGDSFVERKTERGLKVPLTTIDAIVRELGLPKVSFIKMDIEGAEPNALRGATATIRKWKPRIALATEHAADDYETMPALIRAIEPAYVSQRCNVCGELNGKVRPFSVTLDAQ